MSYLNNDGVKNLWQKAINKFAPKTLSSQSTNGLMSSVDKTKLDGIATGANAYTHPGYTSKQSGLYKVTVDGTGHVSATTAVTKSDITALGIPAQDTNTTYSDVTTSTHGLMTAADKVKLNGIATGANAYTHPGYTAKSSGLYKVTVDGTGHVSAATSVTKDDITALGIPAQDTDTTYSTFVKSGTGAAAGLVPAPSTTAGTTKYLREDGTWVVPPNTTYNTASTSSNGLMSSTDKSKLDSIASGANKTIVDSELSSSSTNPVQNKVINTALSGKAPTSHKHTKSDISDFPTSMPASDVSSWAKQSTKPTYTASEVGALSSSLKGAVNGVAELDSNGLVPSSQLPSFVDDVIEGYYYNNKFYKESEHTTEISGETGKIYVNISDNKVYRWGGSSSGYVVISDTITLGETSSTAYRGDRGKTAYNHSQSAHARTDATAVSFTRSLSSGTKIGSISINGSSTDLYCETNTNTTYSNATTNAAGLMSSTDKTKLDGIATGANNYSHPTYTAKSSGLYKVTVDSTGHISATTAVTKSDITALGIPAQDTNTTYGVFTKSGTGAAAGLVPAPSTTAGTTKYLREDGVWVTPPDNNTTYSDVTTSTHGLMTAADKVKLNGIDTGANAYTHPGYTEAESGLYKVTVDGTGHVSGVSEVTKSDITALGIPSTNTTYSVASTSSNGLMSSTDKSKLDGIATGANAYTHPGYTAKSSGLYKVTVDGTGHVSATTAVTKSDITALGIPAQDTNTTYSVFTKSGTGAAAGLVPAPSTTAGTTKYLREDGTWVVPPNTTYGNMTAATSSAAGKAGLVPAPAAGKQTSFLRGDGTWVVPTNTTYSDVTTSTHGLMTAADKVKLNGIASGANAYVHPGYTEAESGLYKVTVDSTGHVSATTAVTKSDITALGIPAQDTNTTYGVASTSSNGLMSSTDKSKLDGIASGANNYSHPGYTAKSSGLYKVTVDGTGHVSATTAVTKSDITALGIPAQDTNTTYGVFTKSGTGAAAGLVPAPSTTAGTTKYLREDGTWVVPPDNNTTYGNMTAATSSAAGKAGLVPAPAAGKQTSFLRGDGTWVVPTNTTYGVASTSVNGLMSASDKAKLNGIASGANAYTHPGYTEAESGLYKVTVDSTGHVSATTAVTKSDITALGIPAQDTNTTYSVASTSSNGLMSSTDKSKLDGIATGANNYSHPGYTAKSSGLYKVTVDGTGHVSAVTAVTKNDITALGIPAQDTNTTYGTFVKSGSGAAAGLVPAPSTTAGTTKYLREDGTWQTPPDNNTTYGNMGAASSSAAGKAGLVPAPAAGKQTSFLRGDGTWVVPTNTTYGVVSTSANGLMTAADKVKLNGIASGANNYSHPTYTEAESGLYKVTVDGTGHVSAVTAVTKSDITALGIPAQDTNTTYGVASTSSNGLMSSTDKSKLDGIASGANNYSHPGYTAKSSGLYKVTVDGTGHVSATTAVTKSDITALGIPAQDTNTTYSTFVKSGTGAAAGLVPAPSTTAGTTKYLREDGTWQTPPDNNTTYGVMGAASSSAAGKTGLVPAPAAGKQTSFLRGDGTWVVPTNTTYGVASTSTNGLMSSTDKSKLDGIAAGANNYSHPTSSGNKHIPSGGSSGQILRWSADGTAVWGTDNNTTYSNMTAATSSAAGKAGLVPAPAAGKQTSFLRGDGTWVVPTNTTYSDVTTSTHGLMTAADKVKLNGIAAGANAYVHPGYPAKSSGFYKVTVDGAGHVASTAAVTKSDITALGIPSTNTTYSIASTSANGLMSAADKAKLDKLSKGTIIPLYYQGAITKSSLPSASNANKYLLYIITNEQNVNLYGWNAMYYSDGSKWVSLTSALSDTFSISGIPYKIYKENCYDHFTAELG